MLGQELELEIEKGVYRGLGLARHEGRVVFVERGLPGDRLRARIVGEERGYLRATSLELLKPGRDRRGAPCAHAGACGGCSYQELDYPAQLALKEAILRESLRRAGLPPPGELALQGSPEQGWRMRAVLHLDRDLRLGLHERGSHRVVDLERCLQLSPELNAAARSIVAALRERPALVGAGGDVELIESSDGSERIAALPLAPEELVGSDLAARLQELGALTGLGLLRAGSRRGFVPLWGARRAEARVGSLRLGFSPGSFFQGNRYLLEPLVETVVALTEGAGPVVDLYAGVGLFGLVLAGGGRPVEAVEASAAAVADARLNLAAAGRLPLRLHHEPALHWLRAAPRRGGESVVLDPPRSGAGPAVVQALAARRPAAIVYVSCDPTTLARDLALFGGRGYAPDAWRALDLFPDTFHLEAVVRLRPRRRG